MVFPLLVRSARLVRACVSRALCKPFQKKPFSQEWREGKRVAAILDAEDAEQEAVADQHEASPGQDCKRLDFWVGKTWDFVGQGNGGQGKESV